MPDYVFGYGSLLERASRTRTNPDAIGAWPARVKGFERGWFHQFKNFVGNTCTFLGALTDTSKTVNGVIYPVDDIESTKKREVGYTATPIPSGQIEMLDGGESWNPGTTVYIFVSNPESVSPSKAPTKEIPMVQSYVDICINGCLELEALYRKVKLTFTKEFIDSTGGWNEFWVNDRIYPRRASIYIRNSYTIDAALEARGKLKFRQLRDL